MDSKFMNNAYVLGEVRDIELTELGSRKNARCRVNVYTNNGFINVQLNASRNADENYAEKLYDRVSKGDIIQVSGSLEEFYYNDTYRRNILPYVSNAKGWGNSIKIFAGEEDKEFKANARVSGDVIEKEDFVDDDTEGTRFTILHYNLYNRETGNNDLTRKEVLMNSIKNYGDYAKDNDVDINFSKLTDLRDNLEGLEDTDIVEMVNIYKEFKEVFNPLMFNVGEYHITAKDRVAEEMQEVELYDNITVGVYIKNNTILDEFGFANGSENVLEVGKYRGINASLGSGVESVNDSDFGEW